MSGAAPVPLSAATVAPIPTGVGITAGSPDRPPATRPSSTDTLSARLDQIQELARYALPTQDTRTALIQKLSDRDLQQGLTQVLVASDRQIYDAQQEKTRMNAIAVIGLILRYPDVSHREDIALWVKQRILTVDFTGMKDLRVKQSVYGDITELLMILRQHDTETYEDLARRITETKNKALKTALAASR